MMIVDHLAAGILAPSMLRTYRNWPAMAASVSASLLPDLPILFSGGPGTVGYLAHRAGSHSLLLAPLLAMVPALLVFFGLRCHTKNSFLQLYLLALLSLSIHLFLDLLTPFGTKLLYPLTNGPFSLDLLHSFDPIFMAISLCVLAVSGMRFWHRRYLSRNLLRLFLLLYLGYTAASGLSKWHASGDLEERLRRCDVDAEYVRTIPRTFWRWKGIGRRENHLFVVGYDGGRPVCDRFVGAGMAHPLVSSDPDYGRFLEYARYPAIRQSDNRAELMNLIYSSSSYRLSLEWEDDGAVVRREVSGFDLLDPWP